MSGDLQSALEEAEEKVGEKGEEGGGDGAGADGDDDSGANASENDGQGKRESYAEENSRARHAHGFSGFENPGINAGESNVSVPQDGQQGEDEGDDSGALADAADERYGNE